PPLPLQEFLPAQPPSPVLQPPWPLQEFLPLQLCFSAVAQPPSPLQEFLPAQPPSPALQPPFPLHEFIPLQAPSSLPSAFFSSAESLEPATMPATTAPMIFANSLRSIRDTPSRFGLFPGRPEGIARPSLGFREVNHVPIYGACQGAWTSPGPLGPARIRDRILERMSDRPRSVENVPERVAIPLLPVSLVLECVPERLGVSEESTTKGPMHPELERLIRLQQAESGLKRVEGELAEGPKEKAALEAK